MGYKRCENIYDFCEDYAILTIIKNNGDRILTKIDFDDVEKCKKFSWIHNGNGYIISSNNSGRYPLHRFIMNIPARRQEYVIDHINTDILDNRKNNLRVCTIQENCRNLRNRKIGTAEMIGVRKDKRCQNSWRSQIYIDRNKRIEKTYKNKELAILQRLVWELEYFNEFAPQIELIKSQYSYLLEYFKVSNYMKFNPDITKIYQGSNNMFIKKL